MEILMMLGIVAIKNLDIVAVLLVIEAMLILSLRKDAKEGYDDTDR